MGDKEMDLKKIKQLLKIMDENDLAEISVQKGDESISLKKQQVNMVPMAAAPVAAPVSSKAAAAEQDDNDGDDIPANCVEITSPMVGTFYRAASPDSDPFVQVGTNIESGTVLCILEAMKLMNEFKSEISGKISKILIENGQPVEYGQPLFWVEK